MKSCNCKSCGASLLVHSYSNAIICEYCGNKYIISEKDEGIRSNVLKDSKMTSLILEAQRYREDNNYELEMQTLVKALKLSEDNVVLWVKLGRAYRSLNFIDKAVDCYNKALEIDSNYPLIYVNLGVAKMLQGHYIEGRRLIEKVLSNVDEKEKEYPTILANYAWVLAKMGHKDKATKLINQAERLGYKSADIIRQQVDLKGKRENIIKAIIIVVIVLIVLMIIILFLRPQYY